jgi:putative oxidoreductase
MELDFGLLVIRLVAGVIFVAHGLQKALGWWEGPGPDGWRGAMEHMNFRPPVLFATVSTGNELLFGTLLALGLLTPLAVGALIAQSIVIIMVAHLPQGFFTTKGGIEFPLVLAAILTALAAAGPGGVSIDAAAGMTYGAAVRWGLFLVGIAAGLVAVGLSKLAVRAPTMTAPRQPMPR